MSFSDWLSLAGAGVLVGGLFSLGGLVLLAYFR